MSRILVLGSLNMDLVVRAPRLPVAGETVLGGPFGRFPGGKGANQALAAARLGGEVALIGRVGDDDDGKQLRAGLEAEGVDVERVRAVPDGATGVALITVDERGENTIVVAPGANALVPADALDGAVARWLVVQLEIPIGGVARALRTARDAGTATLLNAAPAADLGPDVLRAVDVLVVNQGEAARLAGRPETTAPDQLARALCAIGCGTAVVTLGADGAIAFDGQRELRQPAFPVAAIDAVAAGDAFVGALAVCLDRGLPLDEALRFACAAGALATTRAGAQPSLPTRTAVASLLAASGTT